jgi:hypothetical protein
MVRRAHEAVQKPEVQEMIRKLAGYGLGVFMPHVHDEETGEYAPLPPEVLQVERNLEVSFEPDGDAIRSSCSAVGWRWEDGVRTAAACVYCMDTQKGHAKFPH